MPKTYSCILIPLEACQTIIVSGLTSAEAERFNIDLTTADGDETNPGDIQFSLSVRFKELVIVRNTYSRGIGWGPEETNQNLFFDDGETNPVRIGENFKIAIYVEKSMFLVSIDEKPFCKFTFRKPLNEIEKIRVHGDVEAMFQFNHIKAQSQNAHESLFSYLIPTNFKAGNVIVFVAMPRGDRGDFALYLRERGSTRILFFFKALLDQKTFELNDQDDKGR